MSTWIDSYPVWLQFIGRKWASHLLLLFDISNTQTTETPADKESSAIVAECEVIRPIVLILIVFKWLRLPDIEQASISQAPEPDQMMIETSSSKHEALRMKSECRDISKRVVHRQHAEKVSIRRIPECYHTFALTLHSCGQDAPIVVELRTGIRIFLPSQLLLFRLRGHGRRLLFYALLLVLIYLHAAHLGKDILRFDILQSLG